MIINSFLLLPFWFSKVLFWFSKRVHSEINILWETNMQISLPVNRFFQLVYWGWICCPAAGGQNKPNTYLCFHPQVIAQFWGHIWGVKPSLRVPCPPCWPASWCTALSPAFGTLTHSWRVRWTCCHYPECTQGLCHKSCGKFILAVHFLCYTTHLIVSLSNLSHDSMKLHYWGKAFPILSSLDCSCLYVQFILL